MSVPQNTVNLEKGIGFPETRSASLKKKRKTKSRRAGLIFPVARILRKLKSVTRKSRPGAAVYLTGVVEYMVAEVLELSGCAAADNKKRRINPRHIMLAIRNDEEINKFLNNVTIPEGGVVPGVHPELLAKGTRKKIPKSKENATPSPTVPQAKAQPAQKSAKK